MNADDRLNEHADEAWQPLIDSAARGGLGADDRARLARHLAGCPTCAAELETMRLFDAALAPRPGDEALDQVAVQRAMARLGAREAFDAALASEPKDEALDRAAVERAMSRLGARETTGAKRPRLWRPSTGFAALGAAAAAAIAFGAFRASHPTSPLTTARPPIVATVSHLAPLMLADGSEIAPDDAATAIQVKEETPSLTTVRLPAGAARFRVRHDGRRLFRVDAGAIEIEDLGTVFRVAHEMAGRVRVTVSEGRVAVRSTASGLRVELGAGDDRVFSGAAEVREPGAALDPPEAPKAAAVAPGPGPVHVQPRGHLADDPADLLAAADVARRSRQPRAAVGPLRRLLDHHPKDPRAPSAAFTLGWVYLTDLNRPRDAAVAFAEAERIAPRGALAEDAAARVAEAWQKAGESRRAAEAARHYVQAYPTGRYIVLMRGLIGER